MKNCGTVSAASSLTVATKCFEFVIPFETAFAVTRTALRMSSAPDSFPNVIPVMQDLCKVPPHSKKTKLLP